jgi:hypothetical protein
MLTSFNENNPRVTPALLARGFVQATNRLAKAEAARIRAEKEHSRAKRAVEACALYLTESVSNLEDGNTAPFSQRISLVVGDHVVTFDHDFFQDESCRASPYVSVSRIVP